MRKIEWDKNDPNADTQDLKWMLSFLEKPFSERFTYICKLQMMNIDRNERPKKKREIKWI
ncbi:MAG: hypothetical protein ACNS62_14125 [Candidatus Cyclobacteriaceae bacterium M3_2C_046]